MKKIPDYLFQAPAKSIATPPVQTKLQELPYDKLSWVDFEKLCMRLIEMENDVQECTQYGNPGDSQEGIDFYAKTDPAEKYTVYQCKNVASFKPSKIKEAVNKFLDGNWVEKSDALVLCIRISLSAKVQQDEIIKQYKVLENKNVDFRIWDSNKLNKELKKHPQLVYDFFGEQWAKAFCGELMLQQIKITTPLPSKQTFRQIENYISRKIIESGLNQFSVLSEPGESLLQIIKKESKVALLGSANIGKSIELENLAFQLSQENEPYYPFLLKLNFQSENSIVKELQETIKDIPEHSVVLLLDGLDEVPTGYFDATKRKIIEFATVFPKAKIVVSCRWNFYSTELRNSGLNTLPNFKSFHLAVLSKNDIEKYLSEKMPLKQISFLKEISEKNFDNLIHIPDYLIKMTKKYAKENKIAENRAEFYEEIIMDSISQDTMRYFPERDVERIKPKLRIIIGKIAFILVYQGKFNITLDELRLCLGEDEIDLIKHANSIIICEDGIKSVWRFQHNTIQEYLAAKEVSNTPFKRLVKIISFRPNFQKVKPTWVNTLSFLVSILDEKNPLVSELISYLMEREPELITKFEPEKIETRTRDLILEKIFKSHKDKKQYLNRATLSIDEFSRFTISENSLKFLIKELDTNNPIFSLNNALLLISAYNTETMFPAYRSILKNALEVILHGPEESIKYNAIHALVDNIQLTLEEFNSFFEYFKSNKNSWIRYTLFNSIHKQGYANQFVEFIIEQTIFLIKEDDRVNGERLGNEFSELQSCLESCSSYEAVYRILNFIVDDYQSIYYSIHFKDIIEHILNICANQFPTSEEMFQKILLIFKNENVHYENIVNQFVQYFEITGNSDKAFRNVYQDSRENLKWTILTQLSLLMNEESLDFLISEFENHRIKKEEIEEFQYCLERQHGKNNQWLIEFNKKINKIDTLPLPVYPDFESINHSRNEMTKNILFDKDKFISSIEQVFIDEGKDVLTYDEIWEIQRSEDHDKYLPVVYTTLRIYNKREVRERSKLSAWLNANWTKFSIDEIIKFIKQYNDSTFTEQQYSYLLKWCDDNIKNVDFKTALAESQTKGVTFNKTAVNLSFLIRKFNLNHYDKEIYLDMLLFYKYDDSEISIFNFVKNVVPVEELNNRVMKNLGSGISFSMVLEEHLNYCKEHQLMQVTHLLIRYIEKENYDFYKCLDAFLVLNGDIHQLEKRLSKFKGDYRYKVIGELVRKDNPIVKQFLVHEFKKEKDHKEKFKIAQFLVQIQNVDALTFYIDYIVETKKAPESSSPSNSLYMLTTIKALKYILHLYELGYDKTILQDNFENLKAIALQCLQNISLFGDNFIRAQKIFTFYKFKAKILKFFNLNKIPDEAILYLNYHFTGIEFQYYVNKSTDTNLKEAILQHKKLP